jgi:hypothetical protein
MTTNDIINIANKAYPDNQIKQNFYLNRGGMAHKTGDTLALFIVREIESVTDGEPDDFRKLMLAERAMLTAARELKKVATVIGRRRRDLNAAAKIDLDREFGRTRRRQ